MRLVLILIVVCLLGAPAGAGSPGRAYCPRVTSEHNADTTDLKRFRNFHRWRAKAGNDLAVAIWQYLSDYETGLYHFNEVHDGPDPFGEYSTMRSPLKMLNVFNMGYCGIFGPTVEGIYHGVGFTTGRSFFLAAWNHCATEIHYDGAWHYLDVDVRGCVLKADGAVASLSEVMADSQLWQDARTRVKPYVPSHATPERIARVAKIYAGSEYGYQYRWWQGSHTADFYLRPGESFTRYWQPKGGRWNHVAKYNKIPWLRKLIEKAPRGAKPNHRNFTKWNHGNGLLHYAPLLTAGSGDLAAGARSVTGLKAGAGGLRLSADAGEVVFDVFTPFIIVPKVNDLDDFTDDAEASIVTAAPAAAMKVAVSTDNGRTWTPAGSAAAGAKAAIDLTPHVKGRYGYRLKLSFIGKAGAVALGSLAVDTWVQVAPISLPRLKPGVNKCRYDAGDRFGEPTAPQLVLPNVADAADLVKYVVELPKAYKPESNKDRIVGPVVLKLAAPAGTKIKWFNAGATFSTYQKAAAAKTANSIAYAVGSPKNFKPLYRAAVPTWTQHWRYNHDVEVRLDEPAEVVYVRYVGKPSVNVIRACLHLTPPTPHDPAVRITHGYRLDGKLTETAVDMAAPGDYTVDCKGKAVENVFIRMAKPSTK